MKKALIAASVLMNIIFFGALCFDFARVPAKSPSVSAQKSVESMKEMITEAEREIALTAYGEENIDQYMNLFMNAFNGDGSIAVMVSNERVLWKSHAIHRGRLLAHPVDSLEIFLGTSNKTE